MKKYSTSLVIQSLISVFFCCTALADGGEWVSKTSFGGSGRTGAVGFSIGQKGYIGLGGYFGSSPYSNDLWEYDPATDAWTQKANYGGTARAYAVAFTIGNRAYVGTGDDGTMKKDFWQYNPASNIWMQKMDFGGTPRKGAVGFSIGNKGYVGTGDDGTNRRDFWEYDTTFNSWTAKANFGGTSRSHAAGFSIGTKGYIGTGDSLGARRDFWEYSQSANSWVQKATLIGVGRSKAVAFSIGNMGYIGSGDSSGFYQQMFFQWNPATNSWSAFNPITPARSGAASFVINDKAFAGTGMDGTNLNDFFIFNTYCEPSYGSECSSNDFIDDFSFNTLVRNNSGCNGNSNNYIHDLGVTTSVEQGEAYPISMRAGSAYNQGFGVWIDYNQDGDFADPTEFVYASPNAGINVFSGYVSIPAGALPGVTRLRVRCNYEAIVTAADFCNSFSYGETEDYNITITQAPPCNNPPTAGTTVSTRSTVCDTVTPFSLTLNGSVNGAGQTYQWQKSPNGTLWNNIPGALSKVYTDTIKQTTHFRCVVTCVGSATSVPVIVSLATPFGNLGFNVTDVSCYGLNDGAITALLTGGTTPYTYAWKEQESEGPQRIYQKPAGKNPPVVLAGPTIGVHELDSFPNAASIDSLYANQYTLHVTDANGCSVLGSPYVNQPDLLSLSGNTANASCAVSDGAVSVSVSGGTIPYSYLWQGGQTNDTITLVPSGIYTVTVTDNNGCADSLSIAVSNAGAPILSFTVTPSTCHGDDDGTIFVDAIGTPPYDYSWSTIPVQTTATATGLSPGNYFVTVSDLSGCNTIGQITANQPDTLNPDPYIGTYVSCPGNTDGFLGVNVYGGTAGYSYQWSSGSTDSGVPALGIDSYTVTVTDFNGCVASDTITLTSPATINVSLQKSNLLCNAGCIGTAAATVTGGFPPYTFLWMPGNYSTQSVTGLCANNYTLTVSDSYSCAVAITQTFSVTQPSALVVSNGVPVNVSCNGANNGSASVNVSGGSIPYSYAWTPSTQTTQTASNLSPNTYSVVVTDANGCSSTPPSVSITQPAVLTTTISSVNLVCNAQCNGSAAATTAGGTLPYTYSWMPGSQTGSNATGLCAGSYTVTIADANNCTVTQTVTLTQPAALSVNASATNASCFNSNNGTAVSVPFGGTGPYSYLWMPGSLSAQSVSGLAAFTYTLTLTDANGCSATNTAAVNQPAALTLTVTKTDAGCNGVCSGSASATVAGGSGPYSYVWYPSGNILPNASFLCAGTQTVAIVDNNNCPVSDTITILEPLAIPVTVTVTPTSCGTSSGTASVSISGPGSIPPFSYLWTTGSTGTSVSGLDAGIYRANVTDGNGCFGFADAMISSSNGPTVTTNTVTPVSCFGLADGTIDISVTGGTLPYTFSWSNGETTEDASALSYGPHEVKVKDATGCLVVKSVFVNMPAMISMTYSVINSGCTATNGSASLQVNGGTSPFAYAWSSGGSAATESGLGAGIYNVTVTDLNGCMDSMMVAVQDSGGPIVVVDTVVAAMCGNSGYVLLIPQDSASINSYQWNTGSTTQNLTNAIPGNYGVTITDTSGCKTVLVTPVNPVLPPIKPICLVTVDTLTQQNIIVWEKPLSSFIGGFNIYRESSQQGIYQKIGFSTYTSVTTFYDPISDPSTKWARYRISMTDICGTEGPVSPDHKTIYMSIQASTANSTTLIWDAYVGYPFAYYNIFRKDSINGAWNLIGAMPSNINTYTDATFPHTGDTIYYHIDVDHAGGSCVATIKNPNPMATSVKSSKSNSSDRLTQPPSSVVEISADNGVSVYPNPNNGLFTIELKNTSPSEIKIFNVLGEEVKRISTVNNKNKVEVDIPNLPGGVYYVQVSSDQGVITKKVIIK